MSNKRRKYTHDSSLIITSALADIDENIRIGGKPGHWPGRCPLINECPDIPKRSGHRLIFGATLVILCLAIGAAVFPVSKLVCSDLSVTPKDTLENGAVVYEDPMTGRRVASPNINDARKALFANELDDKTMISVERWSLDGDYNFICKINSAADSIPTYRPPSDIKTNLTRKLAKMINTRAIEVRRLCLNKHLPPYETEIITIEGVDFSFSKWEARFPEGFIGYWLGEPIYRQHQVD